MKFLVALLTISAASAFTISSTTVGKSTALDSSNKPFYYPQPGENQSPLDQWWNAPYGSPENDQDSFRGGRAKQTDVDATELTNELSAKATETKEWAPSAQGR